MVGRWIKLCSVNYYVCGVYSVGDLCGLGRGDIMSNYIYKGWTTLNFHNALMCCIGKHDWVEEKDTVVEVSSFTIRHYKCKRCNAIKCEGKIEPFGFGGL